MSQSKEKEITLTKEQQDAINSENNTIVSASAGSGKTFVMIQKIVNEIEKGTDVDNILAVTFTKKAAAQMKEKLRKELIARIRKEEKDKEKKDRLKTQLTKIPTASISTIHSFCGKLVRTYFYKVDVDGNFDVIAPDDATATEYKNQTIDKLFTDYYKNKDTDFKLLLECYRKKRKDKRLKELILSAYSKFVMTDIECDCGKDKYSAYIENLEKFYSEEGFKKVTEEIRKIHIEKYDLLYNACQNFQKNFLCPADHYATYQKIFDEIYQSLDEAKSKNSIFDEKINKLSSTQVPRKDVSYCKDKFKEFREKLNKRYKKIGEGFEEESIEKERFSESGKVAIALVKILCQFDNEYRNVKRNENKLDFNDLEHLTLRLLKDDKTREEIRARYSCIFVDEYQDVNPIQDKILKYISRNNTFYVGDMKQAIYGFRGSKSEFFADTYDKYREGEGKALKLSNNFRSTDGVLEFVNSAFESIMTKQSCGFDYSDGNKMERGGRYEKGDGCTEIRIFGCGKNEEDESETVDVYSLISENFKTSYSQEGLAVCDLIENILKNNEEYYDVDEKKIKKITPSDICILTRKNNGKANEIVRTLRDRNIAVSGAKEDNILCCAEVKQMLDILSYIDNSMQDIPLVTSLLSPLGNFTYNELVEIKKTDGERSPFRTLCENYALTLSTPLSQKLKEFFKEIEELKELSQILTAGELIDKIVEKANLEHIYSSGGSEKLRSIRRLSAEGDMPLAYFLAKIKEGSKISSPSAAPSDSIKIMTMHASKGLEFPIVIIADICSLFRGRNDTDLPFDDEFGFAPKYFDTKNLVVYETILRKLIHEKNAKEELKNELNLFYVACTRAKSRLYIMAGEKQDYSELDALNATCYADLLNFESLANYVKVPLTEEKTLEKINIETESEKSEREEKLHAESLQEFRYKWTDSIDLPVKSSASAILRLNAEDSYYRPNILYKGEGETGTEIGTAYHRYLELCDFDIKTAKDIEKAIENFVLNGKISPEQAKLLDGKNLSEILSMPVFGNLKGTQYREQEFLCQLPANQILDTAANDEILLQGAIDLLVETQDGYLIVDYKYSHKSDKELIDAYSKQLELYRKVVGKIKNTHNIKTFIVNLLRKRQINL